MNLTHLHLLVNHLPIIGCPIGVLVLIHGMGVKSNQTIIAAYYIFILCAIGASIAYLTGEAAEHSIENLPNIQAFAIKAHENFAVYAFISLVILGSFSIIGVYLTQIKSHTTRTMGFVILLLSIICFGLVARTGYLGGKIRHTELNYNISSE